MPLYEHRSQCLEPRFKHWYCEHKPQEVGMFVSNNSNEVIHPFKLMAGFFDGRAAGRGQPPQRITCRERLGRSAGSWLRILWVDSSAVADQATAAIR
jgi:hypothetical protein